MCSMKTLADFQHFLFSHNRASKSTVKNYTADIKRFIRWYENRFHKEFSPDEITGLMIKEFVIDQTSGISEDAASTRSVERYLSSLRKFFSYLVTEQSIENNPLDQLTDSKKDEKEKDYWKLTQFKDYLYRSKASDLTIKNYIIDIQQFTAWITEIMSNKDHYSLKDRDLFSKVTAHMLEEYKHRLLHEAKAAPTTINRKLSSLRKYILWAQDQGYIKHFEQELLPANTDRMKQETDEYKAQPINPSEVLANLPEELMLAGVTIPEEIENLPKPFRYSPFPPLRLLQRFIRIGTWIFDLLITSPLLTFADVLAYRIWIAKGTPVFHETPKPLGKQIDDLLFRLGLYKAMRPKPKLIRTLPKSFYAPMAMSLAHAPLHRKLFFHLKHTRPKWYHTYHSFKFVHYVHVALLILCMSAGGFGMAKALSDNTDSSLAFASLPDGPPRLLTFTGRLTGSDAAPITANTNLRFSIYNDATATGSAQLWEEVQTVNPDDNGSFSTVLGKVKTIPNRLFQENATLYIGMTVETDPELTPRKQIPTEVFAATADTLQGLRPITDPQSNQKNAILTLDSSGNMVIGGNASPTFIAMGGRFTLAGNTLLLTTAPGSHSDIQLVPDGLGKIDIQKPIHNTSEDIGVSGVAGAVEIEDSLAITASQSSQSALYINQNSTGPLISASSGGIAKFTLDNAGAATFGDSIMLHGNSLSSTQTTFNLLTTNPINLSIGTSATALSLGGTDGIATINNAQTVLSGNVMINGTTGLTFGNASAGINFGGQGVHLINATNGNLEIGAVRMTGNVGIAPNVSLVPTNTEGVNNLGSELNPFDTLYVTNIVSPQLQNGSFWQTQNGIMAPLNLTHSLLIGATASESAVWQVLATGDNAGTASTSGNLTFLGSTTTIDQLNGGSLTVRTSPGGDSNLTPRLTITNDGNVGIGLTSPAYLLDLPNNAGVTGQGRANAWVTYSSRRFKEHIVAIDNPLEKISQLQGVYYNWKAAYGGSRDIGFIAEDVGNVLPELVEWEEDGIHAKSLKYDRITALTIEGIKAQQDEILRIETLVNSAIFTPNRQFHILGADGSHFEVISDEGESVSTLAAFGKAVIATLETGLTKAKILQADRLQSPYIDVRDIVVSGTLTADKANILSLHTDTIQSGTDAHISLGMGKTSLTLYSLQGDQQTAVASIDTSGNTFLQGMLSAGNISVADTITTQRLVAERLDLSDEGLMTLASQVAERLRYQNITEDIESDQNTDLMNNESDQNEQTPTASDSAEDTDTSISQGIITDYEDFSSSSGNSAMSSSGDTTDNIGTPMPSGAGYVFSDISVTDTLTVSGNFVLSENSIDVVGNDLEIQPLRSGGVSFMAGLVSISKTGDLVVVGNAVFAGNVRVQGKLASGIISPVDDQNLIVALGENPNVEQSLIIADASGSAKLRIKESGDVESEGEASFGSLLSKSLNIVRTQQADASPVQTVASSSAGSAVIIPGQTQRTIITPFVTEDSLIYITPTSDTQGFVPYVSRQTPHRGTTQGSFTIEIAEPVTKPIKLNWWIVN